jgi:cobalt/nickel transport protein
MTGGGQHRLGALLYAALLAVARPGLAVGSSGTDEQAAGLVKVLAPDYRPWFSPLLELPGGGTEPLLFALQAALGLAVVGYCLVVKHRQHRTGKKDKPRAA